MEPSNNLNEPLLNAGYATIQEYRPTYGNTTTSVYPISSLMQPKVTHLKVGSKLLVDLKGTKNWLVWTKTYWFGHYVIKLRWDLEDGYGHEFTYPCHSADHQKEVIADVSRQLETFARQNGVV
jgi:hypothetical protein